MKNAIDKTDRKILFELDKDARNSTKRIAKRCNVSRDVVKYRIKKLEENNFIKGYFAEINTVAMGLLTFRIFLKLSNHVPEERKGLIDTILSSKHTVWLSEVHGRWDLDYVCVARDISTANKEIENVIKEFNRLIEEKSISLLTHIHSYRKNFLINEKRQIKKPSLEAQIPTTCNEQELRILKELSEQGKIPLYVLAEKTGISLNTLKKRIKKLEKNKILLGIRPFININKLGYNYYKIHINLKGYNLEEYEKFFSYIENNPQVIYIDQYINGEDLEVEVVAKSENQIISIVNEWKKDYGRIIKEIFTLRFYKEHKFIYLPKDI